MTPGHGPEGECHVWTGAKIGPGYGALRVGGRTVTAHRTAVFLAEGAWPDLHVLHHCDNPPCVRREHLFLGTHADNMRDMCAKGRHYRQAGAHV